MPDSSNDHWKARLLDSGLPLQSEVARLLAGQGYELRYGVKFAGGDLPAGGRGPSRRASVDLVASRPAVDQPRDETDSGPANTPQDERRRRPGGALDLILACRQCESEVAWLFLPDLNEPDHAAGRATAIHVVEEFSPYSIEAGATALAPGVPQCGRGLQVDTRQGTAEDIEALGSIAQLRFALPRVICENVAEVVRWEADGNEPFLFCPILTTTAPLLVADKELRADDVRAATDVRDLGTEVPYLVLHSEYEPELPSHCRAHFAALEALGRSERMVQVENRRSVHYDRGLRLPLAMVDALIAGEPYWLRRLFTRFLVCHVAGLPNLLQQIHQTADAAMRSKQLL